ncbi:hypothetical protein OHB07_23150 [Streptomyces sp. NBC_00111]|uniref:hypothetical protein n=1 Tax=Streptomyces sp. NBC_00111 TaxID=2975655 RepID=UPI0032443D92
MSDARDADEPERPEDGRRARLRAEDEPGRPEDGQRARLRAELMALGGGPGVPETDGATMAERVMAQIVAEGVPAPVREPAGCLERIRVWSRRRLRVLAAACSGLLVVLVLTPPVRAAVVEWFGFGGVEVRWAPEPPEGLPGREAEGPACGAPVSMPEAARRAGFRPVVPGVLGPPDTVAVTGLPEGRSMVTLCWREDGRAIRLDAFTAGLDPYVTKQVRTEPQWLELEQGDGGEGRTAGSTSAAAWFAEPHLLEFMMIGEHGDRWVRTERTSGPTLLWMRDGRMTFRLEGVDSPARAREIAESTL